MNESENEIFLRALEIADPAERQAFLAGVSNDALRKSVESMLADHARADGFLDGCSTAVAWPEAISPASLDAAAGEFDVGSRLGPYTLTRCIGEGGSGIVFEAEQEIPVRRCVALKILKRGFETPSEIVRLETERQTLALMEHPNIARIIDGGTTASGCPYFVMELVRGAKITEYCAQAKIGEHGRLQLMAQVCSAIQHAHQKGVIHRDLKPSNILVSLIDDQPIPKVIDFGIARGAADFDLNAAAAEEIWGTPAYMSPEQRRGSAQSDTRTDVYSLGVVLEELLTAEASSAHPTGRGALPPPITTKAGVAENNVGGKPDAAQPTGLPPLPRDLQWIVRKATATEPDQRYQTVRALGQDLENYLENRPVEAHPPSAYYRTKKLMLRNKFASAAIAAAVLALISGFSISTWLLFRARAAERHEAILRAEAEERAHVTRAAILWMLGNKSAANEEIERMGGALMHPSVEATRVFRDLAIWNALRGDWEAAGQRLLALSRVNRFDDSDQSDNATRDLVPIAPTLIEASDVDAYRHFHRQLLERLGRTQNPIAAEQILKGCLLLPDDPPSFSSLEPLAQIAEESVAKHAAPMDHLVAWRCAALGLWHYRLGRFEHAVLWSERSIAYADDELARHAYSRVVRAMALRGLGRTPEAREEHERARMMIEATFARPLEYQKQGLWHDWLSARILLRESVASGL